MTDRHSQAAHDRFDLFPYIGLLMCFLGALLLATLGIATLSLGPNVKELWQVSVPGSGGNVKVPVLVEWDGAEAVVHSGSGKTRLAGIEVTRGPDGALVPSAALRDLIDSFGAARGNTYPLFAVRPSGFESFRGIALAVRAAKVDLGYEPIGQGPAVALQRKGQQP